MALVGMAPPMEPTMYRLPHEIRSRLSTSLRPYKNREAAMALAVFLARFWSTPKRLGNPFPIDRRALANRPDLGLTEAKVRGAIRTLEAVGFLNRKLVTGSKHQPTALGLHRRPILFQFDGEFAGLFSLANRRSKSPKGKSSEASKVLMGENRKPLPRTVTLHKGIEDALDRLKRALNKKPGNTGEETKRRVS